MSYRRSLGTLPQFNSTVSFAQSVDPYVARMSPPSALYAPYGWGPGNFVGMPPNYSHHIDYVQQPVRMYDRVGRGITYGPRTQPALSGIFAVV